MKEKLFSIFNVFSTHNGGYTTMKEKCQQCGPLILRISLGLLFVVPGLSKLMNSGGIIGMLDGLGFPAASLFWWIVILSEIIFGAALIVGWKVRKTVWPLVVILVVATIATAIPVLGGGPMATIVFLFHLVGIAGLVSLYYTGSGCHAIK